MCAWDRCGGWRVDWDAPSWDVLRSLRACPWGDDGRRLHVGRRGGAAGCGRPPLFLYRRVTNQASSASVDAAADPCVAGAATSDWDRETRSRLQAAQPLLRYAPDIRECGGLRIRTRTRRASDRTGIVACSLCSAESTRGRIDSTSMIARPVQSVELRLNPLKQLNDSAAVVGPTRPSPTRYVDGSSSPANKRSPLRLRDPAVTSFLTTFRNSPAISAPLRFHPKTEDTRAVSSSSVIE